MYRACVAIRSGGLVWDALAFPVTCVNSRLGGLIWATNTGGAKLSCLNFLPDLEAKKTGTVRTGPLCKRLKDPKILKRHPKHVSKWKQLLSKTQLTSLLKVFCHDLVILGDFQLVMSIQPNPFVKRSTTRPSVLILGLGGGTCASALRRLNPQAIDASMLIKLSSLDSTCYSYIILEFLLKSRCFQELESTRIVANSRNRS